MYPYKLERNPFPSSPAARREESEFLGGRRWKVTRDKVMNSFLHEGVPISIVIGPYGVGKTHLVFNLFYILEDKGCISCYTELSGLSSGENPVIKAISKLLNDFREVRRDIIRDTVKELEESERLNKTFKQNFTIFGAWIMRNKLNRYMNNGGDLQLWRKEKIFLCDAVYTVLDKKGVDKEMIENLLFLDSWELILQSMDTAIAALSTMADTIKIIERNKIVMAFDELDILEQQDSPQVITEPFRNLINNLPANVHLIFVITKSAMKKISTTDPGLYSRLDVKNNVCIGFLENPDNEDEFYELIKDILEGAGAKMNFREKEEIRGVCKVVFEKKKERTLRESLTLFNALFEMVNEDGKNIMGKACELLGVEPVPAGNSNLAISD